MNRRAQVGMAGASFCIMAVIAAGDPANAALAKAGDAQVAFRAEGPGGLEISGTTQELAITENQGAIVISVPLGNVRTGIDLRDRHMRDKYLEVQKHPTATLSVARATLKLATGPQSVESDAPATLTLHGVSRPVNVHYETKAENGGLVVSGKFRVNMTEFGISVPSYLGVTVKPDAEVTAHFRAQGS